MADPSKTEPSLTTEHRAFRLAEALLEFEHYSFNNWCSDCVDRFNPDGPVPHTLPEIILGRFGDAERLIKQLSPRLHVENKDKLQSQALSAMSQALNLLEQEIFGRERQRRVEVIHKSDPDLDVDIAAYLLRDSPFKSMIWSEMWIAIDDFAEGLPKAANACYRLAETAFKDRVNGPGREHVREGGIADARYLTQSHAPELRQRIRTLVPLIPAFSDLDCNVSFEEFSNDQVGSGEYNYWVKEKIRTFRDAALARLCAASDDSPKVPDPKPRWDRELGQLWYDGRRIVKLRAAATNARRILDCFEEQGWSVRCDDPLFLSLDIDSRERVHDTVRSLNDSLKRFNGNCPPIRFHQLDCGKAFSWTREPQMGHPSSRAELRRRNS